MLYCVPTAVLWCRRNLKLLASEMAPALSSASDLRVLVAQCDYKDGAGSSGVVQSWFLHLRNPVSGLPACYLVAPDGRLQELNWSKQRNTAWFIDDSVSADGSFYLATPVDPLFIILPILEQVRMKKGDDMGKFRSMDDIVSVDGFPGYTCLLPFLSASLDILCEVREVGQAKYYRLEDSKVLAWLLCKVSRLSESLKSSGSFFDGLHETDLNLYVLKFFGEYVKLEPWVTSLCKYMGVDAEALKTSRAPPITTMIPAVKKQEGKGNKQNGHVVTRNAAMKATLQVGTQKITSFFSQPR